MYLGVFGVLETHLFHAGAVVDTVEHPQGGSDYGGGVHEVAQVGGG